MGNVLHDYSCEHTLCLFVLHGLSNALMVRILSIESAENLAQEVFLRVFLHLDGLKNPEMFAP